MAKCAQCGGGGADPAGVCRKCRLRALGQARRKYAFTPGLREALRVVYAARNKARLSEGLDRLERLTGWPRDAFKTEAIRLGITQGGHRRRWTDEDEAYLRERIGVVSTGTIARRLGRSVDSVQERAKRLELSRRAKEGYNVQDLCAALGAHYSVIRGWMRRGLLGKPHRRGGLRVTEGSVQRFLLQHSHEYDLRRVDQAWYKGLLCRGGRRS
jgi:hypothetical protein